MAAKATIRQVTRNRPRTGNLLSGKGCLTERTVDSTAARRLLPGWCSARLRRCRWDFSTSAWLKVSRKLRRRLSGWGGQRPAAYSGHVSQVALAKAAAKRWGLAPGVTDTVWPSGHVIASGTPAASCAIVKSARCSLLASGLRPLMAVWIRVTWCSPRIGSLCGPP